MVHALHEAHRVLKPQGLLIDLRPASVNRRIGIARAGRFIQLATMREVFDDDRAADRAVAHVLAEGLFTVESRTQFDCWRVMDTLDDFRNWVGEFDPPHEWLVPIVETALQTRRLPWKVVARGPLILRVLRKPDLRE